MDIILLLAKLCPHFTNPLHISTVYNRTCLRVQESVDISCMLGAGPNK